MSSKEENIRRAIEKHEERLTQKPHPLTGRPMSGEDAARRARELAREVDRKKGESR